MSRQSKFIVCTECKLHRARAAGIAEGEGWQVLPKGAVHDAGTHWIYPNIESYRAAIRHTGGSYSPWN